MRRATLILCAGLTLAGCSGQPHSGAATSPVVADAASDDGSMPEATKLGEPPGGSSPALVLAGIAIGVGLVFLLMSDQGAGGGYAFVPPA